MPRAGVFGRQLRSFLWKASVQDEVDAELDFHVEMRSRELVARGMDPALARAAAIGRFGDIRKVNATCRRIGEGRERDMRRAEWIQELRQDARYALRQLARAPGFTGVAVLTLAIGIGATTAIFSIVNAVVLRPLPFPEPERLVRLYTTRDGNDESLTAAALLAFRERSRAFERISPVEYRNYTLVQGDRPAEQVAAERVSADFFPLLRLSPRLGRVFGPDEDQPGRDNVVVLSETFWRERLNEDPGALGRSIRLNAIEHVIIGVVPNEVNIVGNSAQLWVPIAFTPEERINARRGYLDVVGRLAPNVSLAQAQQDVAAIAKRLETELEQSRGRGARVASLTEVVVGEFRSRLFILLGAVGFVLLIACVNVANLLLARGAGRGKEVAIRAALGAGRGRVVRQLLTEGLVLAAAGGAAGVLVAYWGVKLLKGAAPDDVPRLGSAGIDPMTILFALGATLVSSLVFGIVPALRTARGDLQGALREGGRGSAASPRDRVRQLLVAAEVSLSLVLLVGAGLLIRSAILVQRVEPGFDPGHLFTGWMSLPPSEYRSVESVVRAYDRVLEQIRGVPGVESAAGISVLPMIGIRASGAFTPEGRPNDPSNAIQFNFRIATPGVFETLRIPIRQGRDFTDRDVPSSPCALIVNETGARQAWPNESVLGKRIPGPRDSTGRRAPCAIVGVVGDVREEGLREPVRPELYFPAAQAPAVLWEAMQRSLFVVARSTGEPMALTKPIQEAVMRVDRTLPVFNLRSMEDRIAESLATARFNTQLLTALGAIGLLLAAVGIYGIVAYFVSQRLQEIGLRMALGATPARVVRLVVGQGMRPVLIGIVVGALASIAAARLLANVVFGIATTDPLTLAAVAVTLAAVALGASVVPARRATRVEPTRALLG